MGKLKSTRTKQAKRLSFIQSRAAGNLAKRTLTEMDRTSARYYQTISKLPLKNFKECMCEGNLAALIIEGFPLPKELTIAWSTIQIQYADAIGEGEHKLRCMAFKSLIERKTDYKIALTAIKMLGMPEIENYPENKTPYAQELNNLIDANFSYEMPDKYDHLKNAIARIKGIKLAIDLAQIKVDAMESKPSGKRSVESFDSNLITLSDHAGYALTDSITVFEYCDRIRRLNLFIEASKTQKNGRR